MESARFDAFVRAASRGGSRRGFLGGLAALALPALAVQATPNPAACQAPGGVCRKSADCCATACHRKHGKKRGKCAACANGATVCGASCCPPGATCVNGDCCTPSCPAGRCAADGCGGTCRCASGQTCLSNGTCAVPCGPGGVCPSGCACIISTFCTGTNNDTPCDPPNPASCPLGEVCAEGVCFNTCTV